MQWVTAQSNVGGLRMLKIAWKKSLHLSCEYKATSTQKQMAGELREREQLLQITKI